MTRIDVTISDSLEVPQALSSFKKRCDLLKVPNTDDHVPQLEGILVDLERRGKELKSAGAQLKTEKVLRFPNYTVKITATYGVPQRKSPIAWILDWLAYRKR